MLNPYYFLTLAFQIINKAMFMHVTNYCRGQCAIASVQRDTS